MEVLNKKSPLAPLQIAKEANIECAVRLNLHLSSSGELLEVLLKESSGYKALDDYAMAIIKEVPAYPPFPSTVDLKELWVEIPVLYKLE